MDNRQFWYSHPADIEKVMKIIRPHDVVLDVGGGRRPLSRADHVADSIPWKVEDLISVKGWSKVRFSKKTWIKMDLSSGPLPFDDKSVDFVFCSQVLSEIRDPIHLCREMVRVGKSGYIDFPTKWIECQKFVGAGNLSEYYAGHINHQWLIEAKNDHLTFIPKTGLESVVNYEKVERSRKLIQGPRIWSSSLFWEADFTFEKKKIISAKTVHEDFRKYFGSFDYRPYEKELKLINRAKKLNKDHYDKMLVHAWQHFQNGRYNLTIKPLRDILKDLPDNIDAEALLGICAMASSRSELLKKNRKMKPEPVSV